MFSQNMCNGAGIISNYSKVCWHVGGAMAGIISRQGPKGPMVQVAIEVLGLV